MTGNNGTNLTAPFAKYIGWSFIDHTDINKQKQELEQGKGVNTDGWMFLNTQHLSTSANQ